MGATTLKPGEATTVQIAMMMHRGMEGAHRFRITLPVQSPAAGSELMAMEVRADFR